MNGWLIINGFFSSEKFSDIYSLLTNAAEKRNVKLIIKNTVELSSSLGDNSPFFPAPDFVLFWDKDLSLARRIEKTGIRVFNSARAIELCDDKTLTAEALFGKVKTPETLIAPKTFEGVKITDEFLIKAEKTFGFPMVVKEAFGSFGKQVYLVKNREELRNIVDKIGFKPFLIQEYIKSSCGRDVRVYVVGDKVVCRMLRVNKNDFRSNVSGGGEAFPFEENAEIDNAALLACRALGTDFAGVDVMFGENSPVVCEVNSNPHFRSALTATGVNLADYIMNYVINSLLQK